MSIRFNTSGNSYAQIEAGAPSSVEVFSQLITRSETFDGPINVVAVSEREERP
jgi:hypothetical protein